MGARAWSSRKSSAAAAQIAAAENVANRGYRLAFNVGEDAGMTIPHLHMHMLAGRHLAAEG
jgi:histidine triad (HIT) family protein